MLTIRQLVKPQAVINLIDYTKKSIPDHLEYTVIGILIIKGKYK